MLNPIPPLSNMKTTKIAILGNGNVGSALARGLSRTYSSVQSVGNDKAAQQQAVKNAEVVILAVPFPALDDVIKNLGGALDGKVVVDATNALDASMNLAVGHCVSELAVMREMHDLCPRGPKRHSEVLGDRRGREHG